MKNTLFTGVAVPAGDNGKVGEHFGFAGAVLADKGVDSVGEPAPPSEVEIHSERVCAVSHSSLKLNPKAPASAFWAQRWRAKESRRISDCPLGAAESQ